MTKLSATKYTLWKPRMEDLISCKDLYDPLEAKGKNSNPSKKRTWKKLHMKTIDQIRQ